MDGTKEILEGLLEGLDAALTKKVYVVDLLPNRFRVLHSFLTSGDVQISISNFQSWNL